MWLKSPTVAAKLRYSGESKVTLVQAEYILFFLIKIVSLHSLQFVGRQNENRTTAINKIVIQVFLYRYKIVNIATT